jgi:hypothetical protein
MGYISVAITLLFFLLVLIGAFNTNTPPAGFIH